VTNVVGHNCISVSYNDDKQCAFTVMNNRLMGFKNIPDNTIEELSKNNAEKCIKLFGEKYVKLIPEMNSIEELHLESNNLGALCAGFLASMCNLKVLNLNNNHIGNTGIENLSRSKSIIKLHVRNNDINTSDIVKQIKKFFGKKYK